MARRLMVLLLAAGIGLFCVTGCKKSQPEAAPMSKAEFKAEADKEITEENMTEQLDSLEKEINADTAGEE
jgi:hypothetical protein